MKEKRTVLGHNGMRTGRKEMEIGYVNGVPRGRAKFWFPDGSVKGEGIVRSEVPGGGWILVDPEGINGFQINKKSSDGAFFYYIKYEFICKTLPTLIQALQQVILVHIPLLLSYPQVFCRSVLHSG